MQLFLILAFGICYAFFGVIIFARPKLGARIISAIPLRTGFRFKLVSADQKLVRPSIMRLLGVACIFIGLFLVFCAKKFY